MRIRNAVFAKRLYDKVQDDYLRLQELETLRDNLTKMITHDLRAPLALVSGDLAALARVNDPFREVAGLPAMRRVGRPAGATEQCGWESC